MSIKYLQDQQLNQVQQSPIDSPWAKLVAQSEMLERSRMRQPQGQAPQGTVAGNIQQQLIDTQMKQESERQNADLYKAQMLSQLIGSGHLPANFAAQGYADGGLTQPGTGVYRGIMVPSQQPARPTSYVPPNSQDPAAQAKKHGMVQSLLDDSIVGMFNGRGNINNTFQDIADVFTGKMFGRGFAEGGDIRGFAAGGESLAEQLARIRPQIEATLKDQGWTKEAIDRYVSAYKPEMGRGFTNQFPATTAQPPSLNDMLELQRRKVAQTGLGVKDPNTIHIPPESKYPTGVSPKLVIPTNPVQQSPAMEALAQSPEAQKLLSGPPSRTALPHITQVSESPELQEYYKSLYGPKPDITRSDILSRLGQANAPEEAQIRIPTREDMLRQTQGTATGTDPLAEFKNKMYGTDASVVNPARSNLMGTLLNVAEQKEALVNQPKDTTVQQRGGEFEPRSNEAKAWMASQQPQSKAPPQAPASKYASGYFGGDSAAPTTAKGIGSLLKGTAGLALTGLNPSSIDAVTDLPKEELDRLAKAQAEGGMKGELSYIADTMKKDIAKGNEQIGDFVTSNIAKPWDKFWNGPNAGAQDNTQPDGWAGAATPATSPVAQAQTQTQTPPVAQPQTPQQGVRKRDDGVIINSKSAGEKAPSTNQNRQVVDEAHGYATPNTTEGHPVGDAATKYAALAQANQAVSKTADEEGQGSILDSLYNKLKDSDVDYSDLAKRISQNEYDLARERKDGTFNAILGGVGAALSKAGSFEGVGDRVFRPGLGAIAGAGILGGLKTSAASDEAIDKKSQENMTAMIALKKLKRESMNDVLDAISAQRQVDATRRGQDILAGHYGDAAANQAEENKIKAGRLAMDIQQMAIDNNLKLAQIDKIRNELSPGTLASADLLKTKLTQYTSAYNDLLKIPGIMPDDPRLATASKQIRAASKEIDNILGGLGHKPDLSSGADNAGGADYNDRYQGFKNLTGQ